MEIESIIKELGIFTVGTISIVSVVGYLAKEILENYLEKKVEIYKNNLQHEFESFRAQLERQNTEHQIKFSTLHSDRISVIKELYKGFVNLKTELMTFNRDEKLRVSENDRVIKAVNALSNFYWPNRIYFSEEISKKIEQYLALFLITSVLASKTDKYSLARRDDASNKELEQTEYVDLLEESKILTELELEFRSLIGV